MKNIIVDASNFKVASEYEILNQDIYEYLGDNISKRDLKENEKVKDITYLAQKTNWDPKLISKNIAAYRLSKQTNEEVPETFYFGSLYSGAPEDPQKLYRINANVLVDYYQKSIEKNIVPDEGLDIEEVKAAYIKESTPYILKAKAPGLVSTTEEMLSLSLDEEDRNAFVRNYFHSAFDSSNAWSKAKEQLGPEKKCGLVIERPTWFSYPE